MTQSRDARPNTQEAGSHSVGTGVGAADGAVAGPATAHAVNPTVGGAHSSANCEKRDDVVRDRPHTDYRPAYHYGLDSRARLGDRPYDEVAGELERGWDDARGESELTWAEAEHATKDAWHCFV